MASRPTYKNIDHIILPPYDQQMIGDQVKMYSLHVEHPEVIQLDLVFEAGRWHEQHKQVAVATAALLKEGTSTYSAFQIASKIESYGATFRCRSGMDYSTLSLYCLRRHAEELIDFVFELLDSASFPQEELSLYKTRSKEGLSIDLANSDIYCHREFTALLFGNDHPYGYNKTNDLIEVLTQEQLIRHFDTYASALKYIFLSGKCGHALKKHIESKCNHFISDRSHSPISSPTIAPSVNQNVELNVHDGLQASIKIGKLISPQSGRQKHIQFIVNTILGGYFGSRLMKSIREELGYTYNIYSHIDNMRHHSVFGIHTEVGIDFMKNTEIEIKNQIELLQHNLVKQDELSLVKNYLMGTILMRFDGISKSMNTLKQIILNGGKIENINKFVELLKTIDGEQIRSEAQSLLDFSSFYFIRVR